MKSLPSFGIKFCRVVIDLVEFSLVKSDSVETEVSMEEFLRICLKLRLWLVSMESDRLKSKHGQATRIESELTEVEEFLHSLWISYSTVEKKRLDLEHKLVAVSGAAGIA